MRTLRLRVITTSATISALLMLGGLVGPTNASPSSRESKYLVTYSSDASVARELSVLRSDGIAIKETYSHAFRGALLSLTPVEVAELRSNPSVIRIEKDRPVRTYARREAFSWGQDRIDQTELPYDGWIETEGDGTGVNIYVIDTGSASHGEYAGRLLPGYSAYSYPDDCNGHGTHVSGTAAGTNYGIAPGARIIPVKVLDCGGSGYLSNVIAGIDWMIANHRALGQPAVANMSLGASFSDSLNSAVESATADGILMVVAAGNSNDDACYYSPASAPRALTVGATTMMDERSSYSNRGSCVDMFAPGNNITSSWIGSPSSLNTISGTSMASPHVAGAAAVFLSRNPNLPPSALADKMLSKATSGRVVNPGTGSPDRLLYVKGEFAPEPIPPVNDNFDTASEFSFSGVVSATSEHASSEFGEPLHLNGGARSVWFRLTAPVNGEVIMDTEGSSFDTVLAVYTGGSLGSLKEVTANDDASNGSNWSRVSFGVQGGVTYRIALAGYRDEGGPYFLRGSFKEDQRPVGPPVDPPTDDRPSTLGLISSRLRVVGRTARLPLECFEGDQTCSSEVALSVSGSSGLRAFASLAPWTSGTISIRISKRSAKVLAKKGSLRARTWIASRGRYFRVTLVRGSR